MSCSSSPSARCSRAGPSRSGRHEARPDQRPLDAEDLAADNNQPRHVYVRRGVQRIKAVFRHELGHLFDLRVMNNSDRGRFRRILRQPRKRRWWKGTIPLAEQFAEAYSFCARYRRIVSISRYATYRYRPTSSQHLRGCALMREAARDRQKAAPPTLLPRFTKPDPVPPPQPPAVP